MKMIDLAEKPFAPTPAKIRGKREPYYPSISVEDAPELAKLPLEKDISIRAIGAIKEHKIEKTPRGEKHRTTLCLKKMAVVSGANGGVKTHLCPECGTYGGKGYCPKCGSTRSKKGA